MIAVKQPSLVPVETAYKGLNVRVHKIGVLDQDFISINKTRNFLLVQMINEEGFIVVNEKLTQWSLDQSLVPTWARDCNLVASLHQNDILSGLAERVSLMATCPIVCARDEVRSTFVRRVGTKFQNHEALEKCCTPEHFALFLVS
jgi:hypothetical protein